jgi:branched-subunit amino acid ABC-type transport system permease component
MSAVRYGLIVLAILVVSLAAVWPLLSASGPSVQRAVAFGGVLASLNTALAYALVRWSTSRSPNTFLGVVLGGMVGRLGLMLAAVVAGVLLLGFPKVPLAIAVLSYFVIFMVIELTLLHRQTSRREA